jgi:hypothetical protein
MSTTEPVSKKKKFEEFVDLTEEINPMLNHLSKEQLICLIENLQTRHKGLGDSIGDILKEEKYNERECTVCGETFNLLERNDEECSYHPEEPRINWESECWADTEPGVHDMSFSSFPEGYIYDCCGENGESEGCETGAHQC